MEKQMKKIRLMLTLILMVSFCVSASAEVKWYSLKEGMEKAKVEKKPVIVDFFFGKGCPRCEAIQKTVYDNAEISKKIMDDFIPVRVDLSKKLAPDEKALGDKFDYKDECLLLFLDYNGNVINGPKGQRLCFIDNVEPASFIENLEFVKGIKIK